MNKEQIIKEKTFEDFLAEKHAEDHCGNKKDMAEDFNYWLTNLQIDDVIKYADEHTKTQNQDLLKEVGKFLEHKRYERLAEFIKEFKR